MNKIFTSILALACASMAYAGNLSLTYDSETVISGSTINIGYKTVGPIATWESSFYVTATPGSNLVVEISATPAAIASKFQDCSFGLCKESPKKSVYFWGTQEEFESGKQVDIMAYPAQLEIHRMAEPIAVAEAGGDLAGVLTVYEESAPNDKITVTINFIVKPAEEVGGVDNVAVNGEFVRLESGNSLSYNVNGNGRLQVYSILGTRLVDRAVSGHGSLDLSGLGRGVYIYRTGRISGKIVVR